MARDVFPRRAWIGFVANGQLRRIERGQSSQLEDSVNAFNRGWLKTVRLSITTPDRRPPPPFRRRHIEGDRLASAWWAPVVTRAASSSRGVLFPAHLPQCVGPVFSRPSRGTCTMRAEIQFALFEDAIGACTFHRTATSPALARSWPRRGQRGTCPDRRPVPVLDGVQAPGFLSRTTGPRITCWDARNSRLGQCHASSCG